MASPLAFDVMYDAFCRRDAGYAGLFVAAVRTTGVFCHPTCAARKPRAANVEFFATADEALRSGYRPCKICRPLEPSERTPPAIEKLLGLLQAEPSLRLTDADLHHRGLQPAAVRRWFKKHHHMTFSAYQRRLRLNRSHQQLSQGATVVATAVRSGYESLSGFADGYRTAFGAPPSRSMERAVLHIARLTTPLGPMIAAATERGVCLCEFADRPALDVELEDLQRRLGAIPLPAGDHALLSQLAAELHEYFAGRRRRFDVALDPPATPFRQRVWNELRSIPFGETRSYADQARRIGQPTAVRAVAAANGQNRIAIVIPCHRVVSADGSLAGYRGGLARKQWLLDFERRRPPA